MKFFVIQGFGITAAVLLASSAVAQYKPGAYPGGTPLNYIRTWEPQTAQPDPAAVATKSMKEVRQTTQYIDGLGRPLQTVVKAGSLPTGSSARDLVQPVVYDAYGRETYQFLPYATTTVTGQFRTDPFTSQAGFYTSGASPITGQGDTYYYNQTDYEPSPLNRPTKTMAAGNNWVGAARGVATNYLLNTVADSVRIWQVAASTLGSFAEFSSPGKYAAGELYKTATTDEHGKQVIEFKDKQGQVILKKVQLTAYADDGTGSDHTGWLCTYYLYDDFGRLRVVIQPVGVEYFRANKWPPSTSVGTIKAEQCFRYEYDQRGRMIMKLVPGTQVVFMLYDRWDRLVLTQDANLRLNKKWLYTKYDALNRPVVTGTYTNTSQTTLSAMKTLVDADTGRFEIFQPGTTQPQYSLNKSFPRTVDTSTVLTATYYDNYDWAAYLNSGFATLNTTWNSTMPSGAVAGNFPVSLQQSQRTMGMVTGTWNNTGTYSSNIYDEMGRVIQTKSRNITDTVDTHTTLYAFNGTPLVTVSQLQKGGANAQMHEIWTRMTLDSLWRVTKIEKRMKSTLTGGTLSVWKQTVANSYDALGQLTSRNLGIRSGSTPLAKQDYQYNVRQWLLSVNKDYVAGSVADKYFGMELGYDKAASQGFDTTQYNGNIAGTIWKAKGDGVVRKYSYKYDAANRLLKAVFLDSKAYNFSMVMGDGSNPNTAYDYNGNIKKLVQQGLAAGVQKTIDSLVYTYNNAYSNKLKNVVDYKNDTATVLGDFRSSKLYMTALSNNKTTSATDYVYDNNGNLVKDKNKDIEAYDGGNGIEYNHLNLPVKITVKKDGTANKGTIEYVYDPTGVKLKKIVKETGQPDKVTLYLGGAVYENDTLQYIAHEEGRIRYLKADTATCTIMPARMVYDYYLKDHLGNVRTVLTEQKEAICYPAATLEPAFLAKEKKLFSITDAQIKDASQVNGASSYPQFNSKLYQVHGGVSGQRNGLGIVLKVMAGDSVKFDVQSIYTPTTNNYGGVSPVTLTVSELLSSFLGGGVAGKGLTQAGLESLNPLTLFSAYNASKSEAANRPKAYLNYLLFDEQFKYVSGDVAPVGSGSGTTPVYTHIQKFSTTAPVVAAQNGYIYIFVSNESNLAVFFDNLTVRHTPGPILEETQYYPFGLTMAGISSRAANTLENKRKWNKGSELESKEFSDGSGLELYSTFYRTLDPQLGRFWQIDPKPNYMESPYAAMGNNPISYNDPLGDTLLTKADHRRAARIEKQINKTNASLNKNVNKWNGQIAAAQAKGNASKVNSLQGKVNDANARITANTTTLNNLNAISNDQTQAYTFNQLPAGSTEGGTMLKTMSVNGSNQSVVVMNVLSDANAVHELTHAHQGAIQNMFSFNLDNAANPVTFRGATVFAAQQVNANSEVAAYQAQYGFSPGSMPSSTVGGTPSSMNNINAFYVGGLNGTNAAGAAVPIYPNVQNMVNTIFSLLRLGF